MLRIFLIDNPIGSCMMCKCGMGKRYLVMPVAFAALLLMTAGCSTSERTAYMQHCSALVMPDPQPQQQHVATAAASPNSPVNVGVWSRAASVDSDGRH